jgi:hypothetical protein
MWPGASQALPPIALATRKNARLGIPELIWTPIMYPKIWTTA